MVKILSVLAIAATLLLGACAGTATVYGDGNATGGDVIRGNVSPQLDLKLDPKAF